MALLTISGEPASRWEEVAHGAAQLLGFELVTASRLAKWLAEEFGDAPVPARAWRPAAVTVLARLAQENHLVIALEDAERLFLPLPILWRARIVAPHEQRAGNLMLDLRIERAEAIARLRELDAEQKRLRKARFGRAASEPAAFDVTLNLAHMDTAQAAKVLAAAAAKRLDQQGLLAEAAAEELQFTTRLELARRGIVPAGRAEVKKVSFGHRSEERRVGKEC